MNVESWRHHCSLVSGQCQNEVGGARGGIVSTSHFVIKWQCRQKPLGATSHMSVSVAIPLLRFILSRQCYGSYVFLIDVPLQIFCRAVISSRRINCWASWFSITEQVTTSCYCAKLLVQLCLRKSCGAYKTGSLSDLHHDGFLEQQS